MRGCSFADNFTTLDTIGDNFGTPGVGLTANRGTTGTGVATAIITYDIVAQPSGFSCTMTFSTSVHGCKC